jgi:hypothetical protein
MAAIMALSLRSFQERATYSPKLRDRFVCALCEIVVRAVDSERLKRWRGDLYEFFRIHRGGLPIPAPRQLSSHVRTVCTSGGTGFPRVSSRAKPRAAVRSERRLFIERPDSRWL